MNAGILYGSSSAYRKNNQMTVCEWSAFKSFIDVNNVPAFVFWGNSGCDYCDKYIKNVIKPPEFTQFVSGEGSGYAYYQAEGDSDVKSFAKGSNGKFPYVRLYWKKADGNVISKDVSRGTTTYAKSPGAIISDIVSTFGGYSPKDRYTLAYSANGGTGTVPAAVTADVGSSLVLSSSKLTKTGWTHTGWTIDGKSYSFGASYTLNSSVTAFAAWAKKDATPSPPVDTKREYAIPSFDPAKENIPAGGQVTQADVSRFPVRHTYDSVGKKYARMSGNISALCVSGALRNGVRGQLKAAYINKLVSEISPSCFANCSALTAVNADNSVRIVGDYAFYGCSALKGISFLGPDNKQLMRIGDYAFAKSGLESVKVNLVGSVSDSAMHSHCFASCDSLEQAEFTNSTYLGDHQFDGCKRLSKVLLNNYHSYVSEYCFANCVSLTDVSLPAKTYMVAPHMFEGCVNLAQVGFAEDADLRQLGDCAFSGCSKLTSLALPASVSSLGFIDPRFLSGSSVSRVEFKGIDDAAFAESYEEVKDISYSTNKWYWEPSDITNVISVADQLNVPVVVGTGIPFCTNCKKTYGYRTYAEGNVTKIDPSSIDFTSDKTFNCQTIGDFLKPKNCFWLFGLEYGYKKGAGWVCTYSASYDTVSKALSAKWGAPTTVIHWKKKDGSTINKIYTGIRSKGYWLEQLQAEIGSYAGGPTETKVKIKSSITTFGRGPGLSVTYVSKSGNEYVCGNDVIEFVPEVKVDKATTDGFKYGIWYYNARQLKEYADLHSLPVMFEYSSTACDPCRDFRKSTFMNSDFQAEVKKRPCLFCRVEIGEGEYFDHPTTTQAYYLSHVLNKKNTYIPCLVYYWKKAGGQLTQIEWNYNYRTDAANANWETVLSKLDRMLGDYAGEAEFWPPDVVWSQNEKFQYYANEDGDDSGRYFICDEKNIVTKYDGKLEIDLDNDAAQPTNGTVIMQSFTAVAGKTLDGIKVGQSVSIPDYTYQYYTTTAADAQYNTKGIIFKVAAGKVQYILAFSNVNATIPDAEGAATYKSGNSYAVGSVTGFSQLLDTCRSQSLPLVLLETGTAATDFDSVVAGSGFKKWLRSSRYVMAEVRTDDWNSSVGQSVRQFEASVAFHGNSAADPLPKMLVYHSCSSCTADGRLVTYCRRKIDVVKGKDFKYYTDLLDTYAEEYEDE